MFRTYRRTARLRGFTLIELAIVLAIVGVLAGGLYRLLSASNQQNKDQITAQQQSALISALQGYLADSTTGGGQTTLKAMAANQSAAVLLPIGCPNAGNTAQQVTFCNYLPTGFIQSTTNPYGQTYNIQIQKDANGAGVSPQTYSFMIVTSGGSVIPDVDGARISSLIGGDGGFIYTANVCGTPAKRACGSMGAWQIADVTQAFPTGYGFAAGAAGKVASRSSVAATSGNDFWLARVQRDSAYFYNTMQTNLYVSNTSSINMFPPGGGSGNVNQLNLGNALIVGTGSGQSPAPQMELTQAASNTNNLITLSTGCTSLSTAGCPAALNITQGDIGVNGEITATKVYSASDFRLKKDIRPINHSLADLMKVDPVSFTFKSTGSKGMGVIAQDLEKIYPELVSETHGTKYVDYNGLIGPLIGAVQELKRENDDLRAQLNVQTQREQRLEQSLQAKKSLP